MPRMASRVLSRNVLALSLVSLLTDASSEMIYPLVPTFLATVLGAGAMGIGLIEGSAQMVAALLGAVSGRMQSPRSAQFRSAHRPKPSLASWR